MVDVNIRYGFQAIHSKLNFNTLKGTNLYKSGHDLMSMNKNCAME